MLTVTDVFGKGGEIFPPMVDSIILQTINTPYTFLSLPEYSSLAPHRMSQVYWEEMLCRVHWAATSNLLRHQQWFESCRTLSVERPNFLGFCASLRGLAEGAADASHSLRAIPETLARHYNDICTALRGNATSLFLSEELESALIHFQFARVLKQNQQAPESHRALTSANYISAIDCDAHPVRLLYQELCQMAHPAWQSLHWFTQSVKDLWWVTRGNDAERIRNLCRLHLAAIEWVQQQSVNTSIFLLQMLNVFPLQSLHTSRVRGIDMSSIPLWTKIKTALQRQGVAWGT